MEYFVSYYDYYQPRRTSRARTLSKRTRPSTPRSISCAIRRRARFRAAGRHHRRLGLLHLFARRPGEYREQVLSLRPGMNFPREQLIKRLVGMQYSRSDIGFDRNNFRVRGDVVEIFPANEDSAAVRVELFGDESSASAASIPSPARSTRGCSTRRFIPLRTTSRASRSATRRCATLRTNWPSASPSLKRAASSSRRSASASACCSTSSRSAKSASATGWRTIPACWPDARAGQRAVYAAGLFPAGFPDVHRRKSRHRPAGAGMSGGDTARKKNLIDYGFRLPSAYDNRPLKFDEFLKKKGQTIYVSATPGRSRHSAPSGPSSRSSVRPACWTPRSRCAPSPARSTTCSARFAAAPNRTSACSSPR